jgi:predicted nucleic acid-binding protein
MASIYIETSIIGYLAARPQKNVIFQARQATTREWWDNRRMEYELVTSQLVIDEASAGDPIAAQERLAYFDGILLVKSARPEVETLANLLLTEHLLPQKAQNDARHVAVATLYDVEYLMTWNCRHIANADMLPKIYRMLRKLGYEPPLIVTPEEFSNHV